MAERIDRKTARLLGLSRYFTGMACSRGHVAERYVSRATCVECHKISHDKSRLKCGKPKEDVSRRDPEKFKTSQKNYRKRHPERIKAANAKRDREVLRRTSAEYRIRHPEVRVKYVRENQHRINALNAEYRAKKIRATPSWANAKYVKLFYEMAKLEASRTGEPVDVDHIVPLKHPLVCGLHCEDNLQLLFMSANRRKQNSFWPDMPLEIHSNV